MKNMFAHRSAKNRKDYEGFRVELLGIQQWNMVSANDKNAQTSIDASEWVSEWESFNPVSQ
jgi:hypothetical protein